MFTDPQSLTINTVATSLPRVSVGAYNGVYASADGAVKMTISHQNRKNGAESSLVRFDQKVVVNNPLTGLPSAQPITTYFVVQRPANSVGVTDAQVGYLMSAALAWLSVSANQTKLLGLES